MKYLRVASIIKPHGVKGEVKIYPLTDDVSRFRRLKEAFIERDGQYSPAIIDGSKLLKECVVLHIEGCDTPEVAEKLRGAYICVDRAHAVKLPSDCYFISDLIGCRVVTTDGESLGTLNDVFETNANDVYVIEGVRRLLVPALKKLISSIDIEAQLVVLNADVLSEVGFYED